MTSRSGFKQNGLSEPNVLNMFLINHLTCDLFYVSY